VSDAADIRGHRRTYVGALPGLIAQALRRAGTSNPVLMLDEIEKLGRDGRSDPSAALLEVLDPAQNGAFTDHYLNLPVDLSKVLFLATANATDRLPPALLDRLEIIEISGYTLDEKLHIAQRHLLPRQVRQSGLPADFVRLPDTTLVALVDGYTREAGLRSLEREVAALCRAVAVELAKLPPGKEREAAPAITVPPEELGRLLGPRKYEREAREVFTRPGIALGLAWTPAGGELLFIESSRMRGSGQLILTGQIGEVMQESVQTALSYLRSQAAELGLEEQLPPPAAAASAPNAAMTRPSTKLITKPSGSGEHDAISSASRAETSAISATSLLSGIDVHVHFPAGAIRKDGPSAGAAVLVALASLFTGRLARSDTAMTGEISLRGQVLPVGGVREKVLAAHRSGVQRVLLPRRNEKDVHDLAPEVKAELTLIWCSTAEELLAAALLPATTREDAPVTAPSEGVTTAFVALAARGREAQFASKL